jgi:hypothetical protein
MVRAMIRFTCAPCLAQMEVPEEQGGRGIACPRCGHVQYVPTLLPVEAPAAAPRLRERLPVVFRMADPLERRSW